MDVKGCRKAGGCDVVGVGVIPGTWQRSVCFVSLSDHIQHKERRDAQETAGSGAILPTLLKSVKTPHGAGSLRVPNVMRLRSGVDIF